MSSGETNQNNFDPDKYRRGLLARIMDAVKSGNEALYQTLKEELNRNEETNAQKYDK